MSPTSMMKTTQTMPRASVLSVVVAVATAVVVQVVVVELHAEGESEALTGSLRNGGAGGR